MRGVVADELERVLVARGDDLEHDAVRERRGQIAQPVEPVSALARRARLDRERGAGQALPHRTRGIGAGGAVGELERGAVGERDLHRRGPRLGRAANA